MKPSDDQKLLAGWDASMAGQMSWQTNARGGLAMCLLDDEQILSRALMLGFDCVELKVENKWDSVHPTATHMSKEHYDPASNAPIQLLGESLVQLAWRWLDKFYPEALQ